MTGAEFREKRLAMHYTQSEFGSLIGYAYPQQKVSGIESRRRKTVPKRIENMVRVIERLSATLPKDQVFAAICG